MNNTKQPSKFRRFLRNNAALLLLIFCVLAITAVVLAVTLSRNTPVIPDDPVVNNPNDDNPGSNKPDDDKPSTPSKKKVQVYFAAPVRYTAIGMDFTDSGDNMFVFNSTLELWETHKALDLLASEGSEVVSMFEGTVLKVGSTYNHGDYVVIDHGDNVIATYASLQNVAVKAGQKLQQGDVIGEASISASTEYVDGAHVHLEVAVNGVKVDPTPYVNGTIYREYEVDA
ncbi:MAG: M23 family metallopeptidase [Clostridiales bacterium]|nr:M23 family metallopeptidase [Clostridiales bacterium]